MRILQRIITLALACCFVLSLAACGKPAEEIRLSGSLVVYYEYNYRDMYNQVGNIFRELYPHVDLIMEEIGKRGEYNIMEYSERVMSDIEAGHGPDIITASMLADVNLFNMMDAGYFLDLDEYFWNDDGFDPENYIMPVLDGGIYAGYRYLVPIYFTADFYVGAQGVFDRIGFDVNMIGDGTQFYAALADCLHAIEYDDTLETVFDYDSEPVVNNV